MTLSRSALIETDQLASLSLGNLRVVETGQTRDHFESGHIPGSVFWPLSELFAPDFRLRTDAAHFAALLSRSGITPDTLVVCSFSEPNMEAWAPWLFWILTGFGHTNAAVLNGGNPKWRAEGRPLTCLDAQVEASHYPPPPAFGEGYRAMLSQVREAVESIASSATSGALAALLDARSEAEFRGEHFFDAPPRPGERAGHIPGAKHLPYSALLHSDGTFRSVEELHALTESLNLRPERETITYCAVGIRSALLWFALTRLLGFSQVRNYDGSWNEWSRAQEEA